MDKTQFYLDMSFGNTIDFIGNKNIEILAQDENNIVFQ